MERNRRIIAISDIHGCYSELKKLIEKLECECEYIKNSDMLIFLGDYIDRGPDSKKVISFVRQLQQESDNVIALMGNHEKMCIDYLKHEDSCWAFNGKNSTVASYGCLDFMSDDVNWMKALPMYYETDSFIFAHAGMNPDMPLDENTSYDLLWERDGFLYNTAEFSKKVVFGHTPSILYNDSVEPYETIGGNIGIDTGCVFSGKLTALIIEEDKIIKYCQVGAETSFKEYMFNSISDCA